MKSSLFNKETTDKRAQEEKEVRREKESKKKMLFHTWLRSIFDSKALIIAD